MKVLLRIADGPNGPAAHPQAGCLADLATFNQAPPLITVDPKRTYVTLNESVLSNEYVAPSQRRQLPPKVFPFDGVFTRDDPLVSQPLVSCNCYSLPAYLNLSSACLTAEFMCLRTDRHRRCSGQRCGWLRCKLRLQQIRYVIESEASNVEKCTANRRRAIAITREHVALD